MTKLYEGTSPLPIIEVGMRLRDGWGCLWRVVEVHDGGLTIGLQSAREGARLWEMGAAVRLWRLAEDWTTEAI
jgi:hypothetical protein